MRERLASRDGPTHLNSDIDGDALADWRHFFAASKNRDESRKSFMLFWKAVSSSKGLPASLRPTREPEIEAKIGPPSLDREEHDVFMLVKILIPKCNR